MHVEDAISVIAGLPPLERAHALEKIALHTPFRVLDERPGKPFVICDERDNDIAEVYSADDSTVDTSRGQAGAIAKLFAAAPQMLATLKEIQTRYSPFGAPGALIDETIRQAEGRV